MIRSIDGYRVDPTELDVQCAMIMAGRRAGEPSPLTGSATWWRAAVGISAVAFTLLGAISAAQIYVLRRAVNQTTSVHVLLAFGASIWLAWGLAVPVLLAFGRLFDFRPGRRLASAMAHLFMLLAAHVGTTLFSIVAGIRLLDTGETIPWNELLGHLFTGSRFQIAILLYGSIFGLGRGLDAWLALRERERQAERLEAQATTARLEVLAARLQPHFLFNTLHTIGALVDEAPSKARAMIAELGELLQEVLTEPAVTEVSLGEELDLLGHYLAIEQIRFVDRLRIEIEVPDVLRSQLVPRLLLQPLVENALRHGIAPRAKGGTLRIEAAPSDGVVLLTVSNNGAPLSSPLGTGLGISTTRERLTTRYGDRAALELIAQDGWVHARVSLPATVP